MGLTSHSATAKPVSFRHLDGVELAFEPEAHPDRLPSKEALLADGIA